MGHVPEFGKHAYNLAFGEYDVFTGNIDDRIVSNHGDREIVLHTVADAVVKFIEQRPLAIILIKGSTPSRVRLYQIGIRAYWLQIKERYEVLGKWKGEWTPFQIGRASCR